MKKLASIALALIVATGVIAAPVPAEASGDNKTIIQKRTVWKNAQLHTLLLIDGGWSEVTVGSYYLCDLGEFWPSCTNRWAGYYREAYKG